MSNTKIKIGKKNLKPVVKKCERCGNDFLASSNYVHFCEECSVIVKKENHDYSLANNIMRLVQEEFDSKMYISVKFQK